ncbi:MAG TPA: S8 family serine peptidase [Bryobacteraceae bacterium]|nr:S8 family serine peptidase [Bryobacteraceae bacterium]
MSCINPGHVIVAPREGGPDNTLGILRDYAGGDVEIAWSIEDILRAQIREERPDLSHAGYRSLPFVVRVREGQESALADKFAGLPPISWSVPDFLIRPSAGAGLPTVKFNDAALDDALRAVSCFDPDQALGDRVKVAILDTGIDPAGLPSPLALIPTQYDGDVMDSRGDAGRPFDLVGHGTLVGRIVNRIAPNAGILSVKVMREVGTLGGFLAGLHLAEAAFQPDIFNLSLSVNCDTETCPVCRTPRNPAVNAAQMQLLLNSVRKGGARSPLFIAAAGNGRDSLSLPAAFSGVIAVGSYDLKARREAEYSRYKSVPEDRYVLAPGGGKSLMAALGQKAAGRSSSGAPLYGTSFSTAFVTGILARGLSSSPGSATSLFDFATRYLRSASDTSWSGYSAAFHGLGLVSWKPLLPAGPGAEKPGIANQVYIAVDTTASMHPKLSGIADHVEAFGATAAPGSVYRLLVYGDHNDVYTVYSLRVSDSLHEIAEAIRSAPCTEGGDIPEALEDVIHYVLDDLSALRFANARIVVFTDAPPHAPAECPHGYDFQADLSRILQTGASVELIDCSSDEQTFTSPTLPGITVASLANHSWA